jgi:hypothetical protein
MLGPVKEITNLSETLFQTVLKFGIGDNQHILLISGHQANL